MKSKTFRCFYCGRVLSRKYRTRDHKRPRSKGGSNGKDNIVDSCKTCNGDKGSLLLEEFRLVMAHRMRFIPHADFKFPGELQNMRQETYQKRLKVQKEKRNQRKSSGLC